MESEHERNLHEQLYRFPLKFMEFTHKIFAEQQGDLVMRL